jgi:hypothetical protein
LNTSFSRSFASAPNHHLVSLHLKKKKKIEMMEKWQTCRRTRLSMFIASHLCVRRLLFQSADICIIHFLSDEEKILIEILHGDDDDVNEACRVLDGTWAN